MRLPSSTMRPVALPLLLGLLAAVPLATRAQSNQSNDKTAVPQPAASGSANFCLFELPGREGATRFVNLGIVQYVELNRERVRLTYGGGKFGSGYDADIAVKSREAGLELIRRIQATARECARAPAAIAGTGMRGTPSPGGSPSETTQPPNN